MTTLFNGENSDSDGELKINTDYASNYNSWRQKEEFNKLKTKYGDINTLSGGSDESSDSESSTEDEEDENAVTKQFDKEFYKTLACLKKKDPKIYDQGVKFFNETDQVQETLKEKKQQKSGDKPKKEKPVSLRDYERKLIVERGGKLSDDEDEVANVNAEPTEDITYVQEQRQLKDSFRKMLQDEEQADDLLIPKSKSDSEMKKEEADYKEWLKGQQLEIDEEQKEELKPLRDFWSNPNLDGNEKFLRDYVLNNKYLDKNYSSTDLDYEHIVHDSDENLSEDEKNIEKQEEFEHKYNFRFEEPDKDFIKRYPRTMENTLRKKDTRRAEKRAEVKQRKEDDKLRKKEELMQLKALKRKEIEEKIEKIREITGNDDVKLNDVDFEEDFDPNEHDRKMMEIFNDDFYAAPDDDMKPEFPDIDEELEIEKTWDHYNPEANDPNSYQKPHCEDPEFNMDADYDGSQSTSVETVEGSKRRKGRRKTKFAELLETEKPKYDPNQYRSYEEYFDKYYSLDYEDMIGDLPCRFKYRKVVPNDYGLSVEEILMADDKELNKWCSLGQALRYKAEHAELNDVRSFKQKAANENVKKKVLRSLYREPEEEQEEAGPAETSENGEPKKRRRRNKKQNVNDSTETSRKLPENRKVYNENGTNGKCSENVEVEDAKSTKAKKRKQKTNDPEQSEPKKLKTDKPGEANSVPEKSSKSETRINGESSNSTLKPSKATKKRKGKPAKKQKGNVKTTDQVASLNPERLKTYGINPKKFNNKLKYGKKH